LANFLAATLISAALASFNLYDGYSLVFLLAGFWLIVLLFGMRIKSFLND
jgi:hypothetical protein